MARKNSAGVGAPVAEPVQTGTVQTEATAPVQQTLPAYTVADFRSLASRYAKIGGIVAALVRRAGVLESANLDSVLGAVCDDVRAYVADAAKAAKYGKGMSAPQEMGLGATTAADVAAATTGHRQSNSNLTGKLRQYGRTV